MNDELQLGLCVSPGYIPFHRHHLELNPPFYRTILYKLDDANVIAAKGKPLIITLNNQCREVGSDWSGWNLAVVQLLRMFTKEEMPILSCVNEADLYWHDSNRSDMTPEFVADLTRRAYRLAKGTGIKIATTSVASPVWPEYLQLLSSLLGDDVDYYDFHPYGQRPDGFERPGWLHGDLRDKITYIREVTGKDVICTEIGVKIQDAKTPEKVAEFMYKAYDTLDSLNVTKASWFAYTDAVGMPHERGSQAFGLESEDGTKRPAWFSYVEINKAIQPKPEPEPEPTDPLSAWQGLVGAGLLKAMQEDGTAPAMASEWRPFDRSPGTAATIESCIAMNGTEYRWHLPTSKLFKFVPTPTVTAVVKPKRKSRRKVQNAQGSVRGIN